MAATIWLRTLPRRSWGVWPRSSRRTPTNRVEAKRRFGVDFFPAAVTELGSGQPFLRFFQTDREDRERGVLSVELDDEEERGVIRNEKEYKHAASKISELENELQKLSSDHSASNEVASAVVDALRIQIEDIENEISEYEDLKEGRLLSFGADDLDSLGELVTKARIARGLSQAEVARGPGHDAAAGGALRAGWMAEDQPVASGRGGGRPRSGPEHPGQAPCLCWQHRQVGRRGLETCFMRNVGEVHMRGSVATRRHGRGAQPAALSKTP